jgi:hypothetical protein
MIALTKLGLTAALTLTMTFSAAALNITPTSGTLDTSRWEGNQKAQSSIDVIVAGIIGSSVELYKSEDAKPPASPVESGALSDSYQTTFSPAGDAEDATISYSSGKIVGPTAYLLVKDGAGTPAWYLFDLTQLGWDGMETLELTDFWSGKGPAGKGAISHVTLYGTSVPDGGTTMLLLGAALSALGLANRKLRA